jgi:hypothetical protein
MHRLWQLLAAVTGVLALLVATAVRRDVVFDMDRPLPFATGFHPPERQGDETFAWTTDGAEIVLDGFDRRVSWQCAVRLRGGRPDPANQPVVQIAVDGRPALMRAAAGVYQDFNVAVPVDAARRLSLALSSPTFAPGGGDERALGVQVDRVRCAPSGRPTPPAGALVAAAVPPAVLAIALGLGGLSAGAWAATSLLVAGLQAIPLSHPTGLYAHYGVVAAWLAVWIAAAAFLIQRLVQRWTGRPWHQPARAALAISAAALYLKLVVLLHPAKAIVDAVFHAHRLEWVLGGRLFFTQPIQDAVQFPYAIALYVFAAPWSLVTDEHVALIRVIVSAAEAIAGGLLYLMIARVWQDRTAAALAVALFHVVPIAFAVIGNANQTNAFGQSTALITTVAATAWALGRQHRAAFAGLTLLAAIAFLAHVSTFALLGVTLGAMAVLGAWRRSFGVPGGAILLSTVFAALLAVVLYYGHFPEVYASINGARAPIQNPEGGGAAQAIPFSVRVLDALRYGWRDVGWPILVLAALGLWRLLADRARDRLTLTLAAWGVAYIVFVAVGTLSPVNTRYERYAAEFISRVDFAIYPAAVVLAARGALWLWRRGLAGRAAAASLCLGAGVIAFQIWARWLQ